MSDTDYIVKTVLHAGTKTINFLPGTKVCILYLFSIIKLCICSSRHYYKSLFVSNNNCHISRSNFTLKLQNVMLTKQ